MKKGRPSKYNVEKYTKACDEYLSRCNNGYIELLISEKTSSSGTIKKFKYIKNFSLPSIGGFALFCGLNRDTIYDWNKKYHDFSDIITIIKSHQENLLIQGGLLGLYNTRMTILLLKRLGYKN